MGCLRRQARRLPWGKRWTEVVYDEFGCEEEGGWDQWPPGFVLGAGVDRCRPLLVGGQDFGETMWSDSVVLVGDVVVTNQHVVREVREVDAGLELWTDEHGEEWEVSDIVEVRSRDCGDFPAFEFGEPASAPAPLGEILMFAPQGEVARRVTRRAA